MKEDFKILWGGQKSQNEGGFKKFVQKSITRSKKMMMLEFYFKGL